MSLSRRYLNVIVDSRIIGVRTLHRIDLTRHQFFNQGPPPPPPPNGHGSAGGEASSEMERIRLPRPAITFRASAEDDQWRLHCFPLADRKVLSADQSGRTFLFDADTRHVVTMPSLHKPKAMPFSLFIPHIPSAAGSDDIDADDEDYDEDGVGSLFVMEGRPSMELSYTDDGDTPSDQFEAYVHGQRKPTSFKSWTCQPLPPPPFVRDPACRKLHPQITSYAVVGGGAQILVSAEGAGTYCMDTATRKWSAVGRWMLPLCGRVEYVPELGLWFGLSAKHRLSAADLSDLDSRPRRVGTWKEEFDAPEDWKLLQEPQLVNLGSGRFCVARFFHTTVTAGYYRDEFTNRAFGVLTGVEVVSRVSERNRTGSGDASSNGHGNGGRAKLRMVKHRTRCHVSANGTVIESVF